MWKQLSEASESLLDWESTVSVLDQNVSKTLSSLILSHRNAFKEHQKASSSLEDACVCVEKWVCVLISFDTLF
jgi:hypothetical protein